MGSEGRSKRVASSFSLVNGAGEPLSLLPSDSSCPRYSTAFARALPAKQPGAEGSSRTGELDWEGGSNPLPGRVSTPKKWPPPSCKGST